MTIQRTVEAPRRAYIIGVIAYHAEGNLVQRIIDASNAGYVLYLFDNSPDAPTLRDACRVLPGCRYFTCGRNVGLGVGLASICSQAFYDGFEALLFFDQDTVFDNGTLQFVADFLTQYPGMAATHSAIVFNAKNVRESAVDARFVYRDVLLAISSGSLFFLSSMHRIGWHNPSYFVDCVDYEFCFNSNSHGFRIAECSHTPGFNHIVEQADATAFVFGKERRLRRYSSKRVRNTVSASIRLLVRSLAIRNAPFASAVSRSLAGYIWWQIVGRALPDSAYRDLSRREKTGE